MTTLVSPDDPHGVERLRAHYAADGKRTIGDLRLEIARLRAEREGIGEGVGREDELKALDDATEPEDALL